MLWTGGIFVCLIAALLALVLSSCGGGGDVPITTPPPPPDGVPPADVTDETPGAETETPGSETTPGTQATNPPAETTANPGGQTNPSGVVAPGVALGQTADAGQAYIDKLTFLGDSNHLRPEGLLHALRRPEHHPGLDAQQRHAGRSPSTRRPPSSRRTARC